MREIKGKEELEHLLTGLAILGTGGGGDPELSGRPIFESDFNNNITYQIYHPDEIEDDALVISGGYLGSIARDESEGNELFSRRFGPESELAGAIREMANLQQKKVDYIVPFEMGGGNTPVIMSAGAHLGIKVIDGDALGRAAPETHMTSWIGHGISLTPMPLVDSSGGVIIVTSGDILYPDAVGRFVATQQRGSVANTHYPMSGADLKRSVIPGTISLALDLGRFMDSLSGSSKKVLSAVSEYTRGFPLFQGEVSEVKGVDKGGFYFQSVVLKGLGSFQNRRMELIVKNEAMCAFIDERPAAIFPDLLLLIDPLSRRGVMTPEIEKNRELVIVGVPCHERLRHAMNTDAGRTAFSAERYGQNLKYRPIEKLMGA
ncbi:MAG: DUF917 domain-containing protein [bacterium]|nr:DUF917 domain-containing protein [bacterium]